MYIISHQPKSNLRVHHSLVENSATDARYYLCTWC